MSKKQEKKEKKKRQRQQQQQQQQQSGMVGGDLGAPTVKIGLFKPRSHEIVRIPDCPAHHPAINKAVQCLEDACTATGTMGYDGVAPGGVSYVAFSVERSTKQVRSHQREETRTRRE